MSHAYTDPHLVRFRTDKAFRDEMLDLFDQQCGQEAGGSVSQSQRTPQPKLCSTSKRPVTISMLDSLQAKKRHPEFLRELAAWTDLFERERREGYRPTNEDNERNYGKRSPWSALAEMEASRYRYLTEAIAWHEKFEDPFDAMWLTLQPGAPIKGAGLPVNLQPHLPIHATLKMVEQLLKFERARMGIHDTQPIKPTSEDPWFVYDAVHTQQKSLLQVAKEMEGTTDSHNDNLCVKRRYAAVKRAYERAEKYLSIVDAEMQS